MVLSNFAVCCSKKPRFIKEQEASGISSSLGLRAPVSKIPLVGPVCLRGIKKLKQNLE